jgi:hypothetical protein
MKVNEVFQKIIERGIKADVRGKKGIEESLKQVKKDYEKLPKERQRYFDKEKLNNPFDDSRVLYVAGDGEVKSMIVGIDIEIQDLLLVDKLREKGEKIDLVVSHHPIGKAVMTFPGVMHLQADLHNKFGVPIHIAEALIEEREREVSRRVLVGNSERITMAAKYLGISLICTHTPADNCVTDYLQKIFDKRKPRLVGEIIDILYEIPEYQMAAENNCPPRIFAGSEGRRAGKIFVDMTGGTTGNKKSLEKLSAAGVGTIVGMHIPDEHREEAEKHSMSVVIAGHISSDTLGMNLVLDGVVKETKIKVHEFSGYRRVERKPQ